MRDLDSLSSVAHVARPSWWYDDPLKCHSPSDMHRCRVAVELFSGTGRISAALRAKGWLVHEFDVNHGEHHDLSRPSVQRMVMRLLASADYVHSGLPCNTYTLALRGDAVLRTKEYPMGRPGLNEKQRATVALHNKLLVFMCRVVRFCKRRGIPLSLENPCNSKLWQTPLLRKLSHGAHRCTLDYCAFNMPWRKRTTFLLWNSRCLLPLNSYRCKLLDNCCCFSKRPHQILSGHAPGGKAWTRIAQEYPKGLVRKLAKLVDEQADINHVAGLGRSLH